MPEDIKKEKRSNTRFWWVGLILLLVGGLVGWRVWTTQPKATERATIKRGEVKEVLVLSGEINAVEYANLVFNSSGEITWMGVKEGDRVKKGQALAKLDTITLNTTYQRARADLRNAEATLARVYDEVKNHSKDETFEQKEDRTTAEVAKDKAYEAVIAAEKNLRNATIQAPFEGVVSSITNPFTGVNVIQTQSQIELINPETMYFEVLADQTEVSLLKLSQEVEIALDALEDSVYRGVIKEISYTPKSGETGTVYAVEIAFDQTDLEKFRMGLTGDASFVTDQKTDVLYVSRRFLNSDKKGKFLKVGNEKNKTYVEIGLEGDEVVEVKGEFKEGETIYD